MEAQHWTAGLPTLVGRDYAIRELSVKDGLSFADTFADPACYEYVAPPPVSEAAFRSFINDAQEGRREGRVATFAIVNRKQEVAGIFQFFCAPVGEWNCGFIMGRRWWGSGAFIEAAILALDFAFSTLKAGTVKAACTEQNARAVAALRKVGATCIGTSQPSWHSSGVFGTHMHWVIQAADWTRVRLNLRSHVGL
jgi:RimJ/RimL family protein N-acetyltransferase